MQHTRYNQVNCNTSKPLLVVSCDNRNHELLQELATLASAKTTSGICSTDMDRKCGHAGDPDSRHSVTGFVTTLNGGAVSWQSVRQQVVALSSAEAEFYAASVAGTDVQYIR